MKSHLSIRAVNECCGACHVRARNWLLAMCTSSMCLTAFEAGPGHGPKCAMLNELDPSPFLKSDYALWWRMKPDHFVFRLNFGIEAYDDFRGSMPTFFIRVSKVVRLSPNRAAAPFGPPTRPLDSLRIRTIRSCSSKFLAFGGARFAPLFANSGTEIASVLLRVRITARSTRF